MYTVWAVVILFFVIFIGMTDFTFRDPDSQLYSKLGQEISQTPISTWVAPRWVAYSGAETYFREHPSGVLWVTATLIRLGAPKAQAAAIANFFYFLVTFLFAFKLGRNFKDNITGWAVAWAVMLMPITFQYVLRGNLEPPLTMATVIGMYCICRSHDGWWYKAGFAIALILAVFFKGMQGAYVGLVGGLFWLIVQRDKQRFFTLAGSAVALVAVMALYEWMYRMQTGEGFWLVNFHIQTVTSVQSESVWQKSYNLFWYLARAVYFALPWSILLISGLRNTKERSRFPNERIWWWLLGSAAMLFLIMSYFDRRADRYIFPGYTLIAMAGGWYILERFPKIRTWFNTNTTTKHIIFALVFLGMAMLKVIASKYFYTNIQFWRD